jgi:hypothetical protein
VTDDKPDPSGGALQRTGPQTPATALVTRGTLNTYSHVLPALQHDAAAKIDAILSR